MSTEEETAIRLVRQWIADHPDFFNGPVSGDTLDDILSGIMSAGADGAAASFESGPR